MMWPQVVDWLVTTSPTVPGWGAVEVFDGPRITGDEPLQEFTVGHVPNSAGDVEAGTFAQQRDTDGFLTVENGDVRCALTCRTGTTADMPAQRVQAFDLVDALAQVIRADQTLGGLLSANGTVDLAGVVESTSIPDATTQTVVIAVHYYTLIR